jgi:excisionase family DNA binding protein
LAHYLASEERSQPAVAPVQPPVVTEDILLTVEQAASTLAASRQTIHNWVRKGYLKAYKLGGRTYFKKEELLGALRQKTRPDGLRKNTRRSFAAPNSNLRKEVQYA